MGTRPLQGGPDFGSHILGSPKEKKGYAAIAEGHRERGNGMLADGKRDCKNLVVVAARKCGVAESWRNCPQGTTQARAVKITENGTDADGVFFVVGFEY